jgi:hypothetical protein
MKDYREILSDAGFQPAEIHENGLQDVPWLQYAEPRRDQGWKLHVSTRSDLMASFLARIAPVLRRYRQPFKLPASDEAAFRLNSGDAGASQIGKIVTLYPDSDARAAEIGGHLASELSGWPGPVIENEIRLTSDAPVYARYGGFRNQTHITKMGLSVPVVLAPDGQSVPDMRDIPAYQALGIANPFQGSIEPASAPLIANRYLVIGPLALARRRKVLLGVDIQEGAVCVLKVAKRHAAIDVSGLDAAQRLNREYSLMLNLRPGTAIPAPIELIDRDDDVVLATAHIDGNNLMEAQSSLAIDDHALAGVVVKLLQLIRALHGRHLVFGDITPVNFILAGDGEVFGVDLELCRNPGDSSVSRAGTHGFAPPEVLSGRPYSYQDDLYSLAATVYFLVTGVNLSALPNAALALARRDTVPGAWVPVLDLLLSCPPGTADQALKAAIDAVNELRHTKPGPAGDTVWRSSSRGAGPRPAPGATAAAEGWEPVIASVGRATAALADWRSPGPGIWRSSHPTSPGETSRTFYSGDAGIAYGLLRIGLATQQPSLVEISIAAAERLWQTRHSAVKNLPGLMVGEAGVGLLFLTLHQLLGEDIWLDRADATSRDIRHLGLESPDLLHGTAGQGLFYTWLFRYTGDHQHLDAAKSIARHLHHIRQAAEFGLAWKLPYGYGGLSGQVYPGMAHGTAGVGYFMAELGRATQEDLCTDLAAQSAATLISVLTSRSTPIPARHSAGPWEGQTWCHGSAGMVLALLLIGGASPAQSILEAAKQSIEESAAAASRLGPTQCHGLAGLIEVLLELSSVTHDRRYFSQAARLGTRLVDYFSTETSMGWRICSERHDTFTPEFMIGAIGSASALARLSHAECFRHFLTWPGEAFRSSVPSPSAPTQPQNAEKPL